METGVAEDRGGRSGRGRVDVGGPRDDRRGVTYDRTTHYHRHHHHRHGRRRLPVTRGPHRPPVLPTPGVTWRTASGPGQRGRRGSRRGDPCLPGPRDPTPTTGDGPSSLLSSPTSWTGRVPFSFPGLGSLRFEREPYGPGRRRSSQ